MVLHITDRVVKTEPAPAKGHVIHYDDQIKGFGLRITHKDTRAFVLNYSVNGHERRYTIGKYPDWTVAAARDRAKELKRDIDRGIDPQAQKNDEREAPTVKDLYEEYKIHHLPTLAERNQKDTEAMWRDYIIPQLGNKRLKDLTGKDIASLHRYISQQAPVRKKSKNQKEPSKGAPVRANRVITILNSALNMAVRWNMLEKNPAQGFKKNPEENREIYLTPEQVGTVFDWLAKMPNKKAANIIRLLIFTGARQGELYKAKWEQFNLDTGEWKKPSSSTKQKKPHRVLLSVEAIELLKLIKAEAEKETQESGEPMPDLVFPSNRGRPIWDIKTPWAWLQKKAKIEGVRIHDLRHTFASLLISGGENLPVIGRLLGHSQYQTTMRYAHLMDDPLRAAAGKIGKMISQGKKDEGQN